MLYELILLLVLLVVVVFALLTAGQRVANPHIVELADGGQLVLQRHLLDWQALMLTFAQSCQTRLPLLDVGPCLFELKNVQGRRVLLAFSRRGACCYLQLLDAAWGGRRAQYLKIKSYANAVMVNLVCEPPEQAVLVQLELQMQTLLTELQLTVSPLHSA